MSTDPNIWPLLGKLAIALHALGFMSAVQAIMTARTPQGSAAWAIFLIAFPYVSLPLYWLFGRGRFVGYTLARRNRDLKTEFRRKLEGTALITAPAGVDASAIQTFEALSQMHFRIGNRARLLVDGAATFAAIFEAIDSAKEFLLVQFYIIREDDEVGTAFKKKIIAASQRGVRVYLLYDEIGSRLSNSYLKEMKAAAVDIRPFRSMTGPKNRFQLNFRNHRKLVIADGRVALLGGHNVGDDYLGKHPKRGYWRDTHIELRGPAAAQAQVSFMEDWNWSSDAIPIVSWNFESEIQPGKAVLILPSGPADPLETFTLFLLHAINSAKKRIWIASPYFVPDIQIISALQLAALRGVDVRIIVPEKNDNRLCHLAHYSYLKDTLPWKIQMYRYEKGFLHEKVLLIDDTLSAIGTANFDNRSFRLNFEVTVVIADREFGLDVEQMLLEDLRHAKPISMTDLKERSFFFRLAVQVARLFAPVL
jgi:cardiolipin synthase A/B